MKKTDLKYYDSWIHRHEGTSNSCKFKIHSYQPLEIELKVKWEVSANWTLSKKIHTEEQCIPHSSNIHLSDAQPSMERQPEERDKLI